MINKTIKQAGLMFLDIVSIQLSFLIAFALRFDGNLFFSPELAEYLEIYARLIIAITILKILVLYFSKLYNLLWRYATINEFVQVIIASGIATFAMISYIIIVGDKLPRSIYILTFVFDTIFFSTSRLSYRIIKSKMNGGRNILDHNTKKVLIVGGGDAGANVIRELKASDKLNIIPICVVDDDLSKIGQVINGVPILGTKLSIRELAKIHQIDQIIIAIPSAKKSELSDIVNEVTKTDCELKIIPGMYELIDSEFDINTIRNVEITDLLGRDEINLSTKEMKTYISGKVVLVTGAGGSIGSELCRQIAKYQPLKLVLLDIYENNVFNLSNELKVLYPYVDTDIIIASVRDRKKVFDVLNEYKPFAIFHAAAHKHVPLMEASPEEAVKNNIFGSYNLMEAAKAFEVDRFVLISTDKAVNPTNVMGATKRIMELLIQSYRDCEKTKFVAVRFGNVLGSNGSVVPIFQKQIEQGGPVTVTHKDVTRYFMTIPEASRLVIQASSFGKNTEIFVLDMGEPVKIVKLAEKLIRLSGLVPYDDIDINFTGLRPGEKMFEELILNEDKCLKTIYDKIFIEKQDALISEKQVENMIEDFKNIIETNGDIRLTLKKYVPTYTYNK